MTVEELRSAQNLGRQISAHMVTPAKVFTILINYFWLMRSKEPHHRLLKDVSSSNNYVRLTKHAAASLGTIFIVAVASTIVMHFMYDISGFDGFLSLNPLLNLNYAWFNIFAAYEYAVAVCINAHQKNLLLGFNCGIHERISQYDEIIMNFKLYERLFGIPKLFRRVLVIIILLASIFNLLDMLLDNIDTTMDTVTIFSAVANVLWMSASVLFILNTKASDKIVRTVRHF